MSRVLSSWRRLERLWASPELWLVASNLSQRVLGFCVSLLLSRYIGVQAVGAYSSVLITAASPTSPMSALLANNATMLSARHHQRFSLFELWRAQWPVMVIGLALSFSGGALLFKTSRGLQDDQISMPFMMVVAGGLIIGQILTHTVVALYVGANRAVYSSRVISIVAGLALLVVYPVLTTWGVQGVLCQAMLVMLLPGLVLLGRQLLGSKTKVTSRSEYAALRGENIQSFRRGIPNVTATVLTNATNWMACIYLTNRYHGDQGVGLIAIGLQWMALMQLPVSSWGGRVMQSLAVAYAEGGGPFWKEVENQLRRCVKVSIFASLLVVVSVPIIARLYRLDVWDFLWLMMFNGVATVFFAISLVYERVFICRGRQRPWLFVSACACLVQLVVTFLLVDTTLLGVAIGNMVAFVIICATVFLYFKSISQKDRSSP